jgi:hypothetical protein
MAKKFVAALALFAALSITAGAQSTNRGLTVLDSSGQPITSFTASYALVIGESAYTQRLGPAQRSTGRCTGSQETVWGAGLQRGDHREREQQRPQGRHRSLPQARL